MNFTKNARSYRGRVLTTRPEQSVFKTHLEEDGVVVVGADGTILFVGPYSNNVPHPVVDFHPHVITPGFADVHVHYPQTRVMGRATGPLLDWLSNTVFPEESKFVDSAYADKVANEFYAHLIASGTTCAGIYATSSKSATQTAIQHALNVGIAAQVGLVLMDRGAPDALVVSREQALSDLAQLLNFTAGNERVKLAVTPRFALSCTPELLREAGHFAAQNKLLVQTHLSENVEECRATLAAFPGCADYLSVYESAGLVHDQALFAHAIHLSDSEVERMARAGAKVAHCPDSNLFLGSGTMLLRALLSAGIKVGLGSDVAAGRTFDMRRIAASAYDVALLQKAPVSLEELFALLTFGGAQVLGFGDTRGALTAGRMGDFLVIDVPEYTRQKSDILGQLLFASDTCKVIRTYLSGKKPNLP
ncbi:MAG: guanine deaminase [Polyangiaceae bacterium]|nr:guanine deaminase [Polyangiaceae bacterium]